MKWGRPGLFYVSLLFWQLWRWHAEARGKVQAEAITEADLAKLTGLDASNRGITNLTGIEHCVNLTLLVLNGNQVSDLSPLTSLTKLTELVLGRNSLDLSEGSEALETIRQLRAQGVMVLL